MILIRRLERLEQQREDLLEPGRVRLEVGAVAGVGSVGGGGGEGLEGRGDRVRGTTETAAGSFDFLAEGGEDVGELRDGEGELGRVHCEVEAVRQRAERRGKGKEGD